MNNSLVVMTVAMMFSTPALAQSWLLTDAESGMEEGNWSISSQQLKLDGQPFSIEQKVLHGGKQEGSKVITLRSENGLTIALSPSRGMDLLHVNGHGVRMGWDSPVDEVVNPAYIRLESRNGLGWLDGFNEMMVRCGFEWTGHPVTKDGVLYTLHGKAGNTPASRVEVIVNEQAPHEIRIRGLLKEHTFKKAKLSTWTELRYVPGSDSFTIHDELTNQSDYPQDYQIIYHSNFGTPILEKDARFIAPVKSVSPFNDYAKNGLKTWNIYGAPTKGFDEMVFNLTPLADNEDVDAFDFIRTIAVARIMMPTSYVRLSAGREQMSEQTQAMCFMAGANSIFYGCKLLTTPNPEEDKDVQLFRKLGLNPHQTGVQAGDNEQQQQLEQQIFNADTDQFYNAAAV